MEGSEIREPLSNCPTAKILLTDYAEVENVVRFSHKRRSSVKYGDKLFYENNIWYADNSVFDIFSFPMISGDPKTDLSAPYSVVITEEIANKYFEKESPLGKTLRFNNQSDYHVTGIIKNLPKIVTLILICSAPLKRCMHKINRVWKTGYHLTSLLMFF